jgi:hypothetical protein
MSRSRRQPRAIGLSRPMVAPRVMRDFAGDWRRWSPPERNTARLVVLLAATAGLAWVVLAG